MTPAEIVNLRRAAEDAISAMNRHHTPFLGAAHPKAILFLLADRRALMDELEALRAKVKPAKPKRGEYTDEFDEAWAAYPPRPGSSKATAFKAWNARLAVGATPAEMIAGTRRYAAYCAAERTEPSYIKMPATFYGPGEHFSADWTVKNCRQSANDEAKRRLFGGGASDAAI